MGGAFFKVRLHGQDGVGYFKFHFPPSRRTAKTVSLYQEILVSSFASHRS
jgi:hypothetical protein